MKCYMSKRKENNGNVLFAEDTSWTQFVVSKCIKFANTIAKTMAKKILT